MGARIAAGRRAKGLTQVAFAQLVGVNPQTVCRWEVGASPALSAARVVDICRVLELDPGDLLASLIEDVS